MLETQNKSTFYVESTYFDPKNTWSHYVNAISVYMNQLRTNPHYTICPVLRRNIRCSRSLFYSHAQTIWEATVYNWIEYNPDKHYQYFTVDGTDSNESWTSTHKYSESYRCHPRSNDYGYFRCRLHWQKVWQVHQVYHIRFLLNVWNTLIIL